MRNFYFILMFLCAYAGAQAQNFKFGKVSKEEILQEKHPLDPEANAAVLFREHNTYYELSGNIGLVLVTNIHERVKIYNKDGFDWATKEIYSYKNRSDKEKIIGIKGVTYNLDGNKVVEEKLRKDGIFEEEISDYREKKIITMPAVTEGSVIEYKYTLRSPFLTSIDVVPLQSMIPINRLEAKVSIPEFLGFKKHYNLKSGLFYPVEESKKGFTYRVGHKTKSDYFQNIYTVVADDVPALKEEAYVDYLQNYAAFVKWELEYTKFPGSVMEFFAQSWEGVTKSIYDDVGLSKELGRDGFFKKDVDELLQGVTNPIEKARLIYDFVKSKVRWNDYLGFMADNGTKSAYNDGEGNVGDINLLLTSMLKYAGLNSNPVLVSTQNNGIPLFPTREGFNYVIASVEFPDGIVLMDATDKTAAIGELPRRARNWQGRIMRENGSSAWIDLMPYSQSSNKTTLNVTLEENLVLNGKAMTIMDGLYAKSYRDKFVGMNAEKYLETLEANKGNVTISNIEKRNEDKVGSDIMESYDFELQDGVEMINDKIYLKPMLFLAQEENPFKADERKYPVFFDYPSQKTTTVNFILPEGYVVESMPESIISEMNEGAGTFKFITNQSGNILSIQSVLDFKTIVYAPQDYQTLKKFYALMVEKQTETVVLTKK